MGYLVVDTETSGLFDFKQSADAPGQPRLAQAALIYLDEFGETEKTVAQYVQPDGWAMEPGATKVNGLTDDFLTRHGVPVGVVLDTYEAAVNEGRVVVAFNAQYDTKVMRAELRRAGRDDLFEQTQNICVMRPLTGVIKARNRRGGFKFPTLKEACDHFGIATPQAHDALADAVAACTLFHKLDALGLLPAPAVHRAKGRD